MIDMAMSVYVDILLSDSSEEIKSAKVLFFIMIAEVPGSIIAASLVSPSQSTMVFSAKRLKVNTFTLNHIIS